VATRELYERYAGKVFSYCLHRLGSREEAEDAVQSTFLNAFRGLKRGIVPQAEAPWLLAIAQNVCLSRRRSSRRRHRVESPADFDLVEELAPSPPPRKDELIGLQDALEQMPARQRRAILLREWQGLSYHEIASELGVSHAAVETLVFRARRSLAKGLERPAVSLRRRVRRSADLGNVLAAFQSLLTGGAAAAKVAATVVVSATGIAAAVPVTRHLHLHPAPPPAAASSAAAPTAAASAAFAGAAAGARSLAGPLTTLSREQGGAAGAWTEVAAPLGTGTVPSLPSASAAGTETTDAPAPQPPVVDLATEPPAETRTSGEPAAAPAPDPAPAPAPATAEPAAAGDSGQTASEAQTTTATTATTSTATTATTATTTATTATASTATTTGSARTQPPRAARTTTAPTVSVSTAAVETRAQASTAQTTTAAATAPATTAAATTVATARERASTGPPGQVDTIPGARAAHPRGAASGADR
jgi:RNA polymerase sigma factor (sigma-70 family)